MCSSGLNNTLSNQPDGDIAHHPLVGMAEPDLPAGQPIIRARPKRGRPQPATRRLENVPATSNEALRTRVACFGLLTHLATALDWGRRGLTPDASLRPMERLKRVECVDALRFHVPLEEAQHDLVPREIGQRETMLFDRFHLLVHAQHQRG